MLKKRQLYIFAAFFFSMILYGCSSDIDSNNGMIDDINSFYGIAVGDEPNSILVAKSILQAGGTAFDAAVATTFSMSVTMPADVSLAGGGVCITHDVYSGVTEALNFIGGAGTNNGGDRPTAIPALVRGMTALHARYGTFDWRMLLSPAENMARQGHRISRASAIILARVAQPLLIDSAIRDVFTDDEGNILQNGSLIQQLDLAAMIGRIRIKGGGVLYQGQQAELFVDAVNAAGGSLTIEDLRDYQPQWKAPISIIIGDDIAHFSPPLAGSGIMAAQMINILQTGDLYLNTSPSMRPYLITEIIKRLYADRSRYMNGDWTINKNWEKLLDKRHLNELMSGYNINLGSDQQQLDMGKIYTENPSSSGFVITDRFGNSISCEFSLNHIFGTGRMAFASGMILAAAPTGNGRNPLSFGPVIVTNPATSSFRFGASASGGNARISALINSMASALIINDGKFGNEKFNSNALYNGDKLTRVAVNKNIDKIYLEQTASNETISSFKNSGQYLQEVTAFGNVNAIYCPYGLPNSTGGKFCQVKTDSRANGLAVFAK